MNFNVSSNYLGTLKFIKVNSAIELCTHQKYPYINQQLKNFGWYISIYKNSINEYRHEWK